MPLGARHWQAIAGTAGDKVCAGAPEKDCAKGGRKSGPDLSVIVNPGMQAHFDFPLEWILTSFRA